MITLFFSIDTFAQENKKYQVLGTKVHKLVSKKLSRELDVFIGLPFNYDPSKRYPTVTVLDADVMFGFVTQYAQLTAFEPTVTPYITIGVGYGGLKQWIKGRTQDYHPTVKDSKNILSKQNKNNSGAALYLDFLENELQPFVAKRYKIDSSKNILYGHSSGGLFAIYTALNKPNVYSDIIATSPSLEWQNGLIFDQIKMVKMNSLPNLYLSASKTESRTIISINTLIEKQRFEENRFKYELFDRQTHMGVIPMAYASGIDWILNTK